MGDKGGQGGFNIPQDELVTDFGENIFNNPQIHTDYVEGITQEYYPINGVSNTRGPYKFNISSDAGQYIALPQTRLYGVVNLAKVDGSIWTDVDTDKIGIVNLFPSSLFKQVEVEINGIQVSDASSNCYGYKSMIETLLTYGPGSENAILKAARYVPDEADLFDSKNNRGHLIRREWLTYGKSMDFVTAIHADFLQSYRDIPDNCNIRLNFIRNDDSFSMISASSNYKIEITDLRLYVRKIKLHDLLYNANEKMFKEDKIAIFPLVRNQIKIFTLTAGLSGKIEPSIIQGQLPRTIVVCFVDADAFSGAHEKNPYNFQNFNLEEISLRVNGTCVPASPYFMNFENDLYMNPYKGMFDSLGFRDFTSENNITPELYKNGNMFIAFDLTPEQCNSFHEHDKKNGTVDLHVKFSKPLYDAINIIVYSSFANRIFIDKYRNVKTDYSL
jgi:hypothetical protein